MNDQLTTDPRTSSEPPPGVSQSTRPITGLFEDRFRLGETLNVMVNGPKVYGALMTFGEPDPSGSLPGNNRTRWFWFLDNFCAVNGFVSGFLFDGVGKNYPDGIENVVDPFGRVVGQQNPKGIYRLWRSNGGYLLQINRYGEDATIPDSLYTRDFHMEKLIFEPE